MRLNIYNLVYIIVIEQDERVDTMASHQVLFNSLEKATNFLFEIL